MIWVICVIRSEAYGVILSRSYGVILSEAKDLAQDQTLHCVQSDTLVLDSSLRSDGLFALLLYVQYHMIVGEITRMEVDFMPKSSNLYVRIEPEVKEQAEKVFDSLGISMSNAVGLFLKQVVINQAIPFELRLAPANIKSVDAMTEVEFNAELEKGYADYLAGKGRPTEEVFSDIRKGLKA